MRSLSRGNLFFVGATSFAFLAATLSLAYLTVARGESAQGEAVGVVAFKSGNAEQRISGNPIWAAVDGGGPVYNRDMIRTAAGSTAEIRLANDMTITLDEESMVLISIDAEKTRIRVSGGMVAVDAESAEKPVDLETRSGNLRVGKGRALLRDTGGDVQIELASGTASLVSAGKTVQVSEPSRVNLAAAKAESLSAVPIRPVNGSLVLTRGDADSVRLEWSVPGASAEPERPVTLTVARDAEFGDVEIQGEGRGSAANVRLGEGTHYWKVSDGASPQWFTVQRALPPTPIAPIARRFAYRSTPPVILFAWGGSPAATDYRLEVFPAGNPDAPVFVRALGENRLSVDSLPSGAYQWKVSAFYGSDRVEVASEPTSFEIAQDVLPAPSLPDQFPSISRFAAQRNRPLASWPSVDAAEGYEATLSSDAAGTTIVARTRTRLNFLTLGQPPTEGVYYLTVRAFAGSELSPASRPARISVTPTEPPALTVPKDGATLSLSGGAARFVWKDANGGNRYRLTVAADRNFQSPLAEAESAEPALEIALPAKSGTSLFWKVALLTETGETAAQSATATFRVLDRLTPIEPEYPIGGTRVDINATERLRFRWKAVAHARAYSVALYRASAGVTTLVKRWETTETELALDDYDGISIDGYAWTVTALPETDGSYEPSEPVTSFFKIVKSATLPAPRVLMTGQKGATRK